MELRRREHARSVRVSVDLGGQPSTRYERCEFTGGRDDLDDRGSRLFGGGSDDDLAAPEPPWPVDHAEIEELLRRFAERVGGEVSLHHQVVATGRSVSTGGGPAQRRVRTVFALTGHTVTAAGRMLPIGVSGRGDSRDVLADGALAEALAHTRTLLATATGPLHDGPAAVLSPQAAAILVHEAVGHYAEATHVGAPAVHRLSTRIADERLSVQDGPPDQHHDDEGVVSIGPTEVLRHGVLVAQLHSRATARATASAPTGNARAAQVWDPPIPRMTTLVCAAGDTPPEALVEELGDGVYIHRLADGYRQGTSVAAQVVLGEHVERGRRTGRYFTGGQVDDRPDLFTRLVAVGDRVEVNPNAMCGKDGQLLFDVVTAAPAMRLSALRLRP